MAPAPACIENTATDGPKKQAKPAFHLTKLITVPTICVGVLFRIGGDDVWICLRHRHGNCVHNNCPRCGAISRCRWGCTMKPALLVVFLSSVLATCNIATAQQYYSFEDACRMSGQTTGPCAPKSQQEIPLGCVSMSGNAFHAEKSEGRNCIETTLSPVLDAEIFIEMVGLPNIAKINELQLTIGRSVGFNNAVALFHNGSRMIILDPKWARSGTAESYLVLGHEAGHHFCGHTVGGDDPFARKKHELEADRFSGATIKSFEAYHSQPFFKRALEAATRMYSATESRSHPSREARLEAIKLGYNSGSPCGSLSPGVRGYTAGPR